MSLQLNMNKKSNVLLVAVCLILATPTISAKTPIITTIVDGLNSPWAIDFISESEILITERDGKLRLARDGVLLEEPISGSPEVYLAGQGGLLDVMLDADFKNNKKLYLSYAHGNRKNNATRLMSAVLVDNTLTEQTVLFTASPLKDTCLLYTSPSPRDATLSRMPSSA